MQILVINTNSHTVPVPVMPLGACLVADAAASAGQTVRFLDLMFAKNPRKALTQELAAFPPDAIGLSVRNIDGNDMQSPLSFIADLPPLLDTIRLLSRAPVILGGAAVAVMPEEMISYTGAPYAVLGDAARVFPLLLEAVADNRIPEEIPGAAWLENGKVRINPCAPSPDMRTHCPVPAYRRWINVNKYLSLQTTAPLQTKLGCRFNCVYCTYSRIEGGNYSLCTPESVRDAVQNLVSQGFRDIEIVDNVFNAPYDHAMEVCEELAGSPSPARLQSMELNPLFVDDALLQAMAKARFNSIGITVESASDKALKGLGKNYSAREVYHAAEVVARHDLPCLWIFMLGGPGETEETVKETLRFAETRIRKNDVAYFNLGIRIYPGTELEMIARKQGLLSLSRREMLEPVFYVSPEISYSWLILHMRKTISAHMNFVCSDTLGMPSLPAIQRLGYTLGIRPPLWRYTRLIRSGLRLLGLAA
ncbi:MAG: radical SAM protein [Nitrospirae bacterium]|nr:radical SAM protein [Nitrospirota bacterium]